MKLIKHPRSTAVARWLRQEGREQRKRYSAIVAEQEALAPKRERWVDGFLRRIQTRGFHTHYDQMRKIPAEEIPTRPRRKFRVVF